MRKLVDSRFPLSSQLMYLCYITIAIQHSGLDPRDLTEVFLLINIVLLTLVVTVALKTICTTVVIVNKVLFCNTPIKSGTRRNQISFRRYNSIENEI